MSQGMLAELCGVTPHHVSAVECGRRRPSVELAERLVVELELDDADAAVVRDLAGVRPGAMTAAEVERGRADVAARSELYLRIVGWLQMSAAHVRHVSRGRTK
jgi:transcriptional regulator with XRE-family HTH domain